MDTYLYMNDSDLSIRVGVMQSQDSLYVLFDMI